MQKENWILKRINESLKEYGYLKEIDLKILRTQLKYHDEYLEFLAKNANNSFVSAYLYMKDRNDDPELFETFSNRQIVRDYNFMTSEIKLINEALKELKNHEWCHHILVKNSKGIYQCVRCGVILDEEFRCNNYILLNSIEYDEGRKLYDLAIIKLDENPLAISIIKEMLNIKCDSENDVKQLIK